MSATPHMRGGSSPERGLLITFEGGEGTGKSTQVALLATRLRAADLRVLVLREPGGTTVGEAVRRVLLAPDAEISARTELLLYEASRAQLVAEVVEPALQRGEIVVLDRFYDSTTAYQCFGRGLPRDDVDAANHLAAAGVVPDRTIVLDLDPEEGLRRATAHAGADRLEGESFDFHRAVREGFLAIAAEEPDRVVVVDASGPADEVAARVAAALRGLPMLGRAAGDIE
jgi:dTMP kinase